MEYALGSPDNVTMGFNGRYVAARWLTFYGQFVLGEFKADEVFSNNQWWANNVITSYSIHYTKLYDGVGWFSSSCIRHLFT